MKNGLTKIPKYLPTVVFIKNEKRFSAINWITCDGASILATTVCWITLSSHSSEFAHLDRAKQSDESKIAPFAVSTLAYCPVFSNPYNSGSTVTNGSSAPYRCLPRMGPEIKRGSASMLTMAAGEVRHRMSSRRMAGAPADPLANGKTRILPVRHRSNNS